MAEAGGQSPRSRRTITSHPTASCWCYHALDSDG